MKTLILIGQLVTGEYFRQPVPADACWAAVAALQKAEIVEVETFDRGTKSRVWRARCVDPEQEEIPV